MPRGRLCIDQPRDARSALAHALTLWESTSAAEPVALYGAALSGEALLLGAHQRAADALSPTGRAQKAVLRRPSGGVTLRGGEGVLYVALGLHERNALMTCPKLRILNRNVRGALAGLRLAGVAAHYFGRDFVSVEAQPAAFVGWDAREDGRVLLEFFVAERESYVPPAEHGGYPVRASDPFRGKQVTPLARANVRAHGGELVQKLADGHAAGFGVEWRSAALSDQELATSERAAASLAVRPEQDEAETLAWSTPREEAIGFVSAGVALDAAGKLSRVRLAGDFFQDRACPAALERALAGATPSAEVIGRALDVLYVHGPRELEGIREIATLREAILDAVAQAQGRAGDER